MSGATASPPRLRADGGFQILVWKPSFSTQPIADVALPWQTGQTSCIGSDNNALR